MKRRVETVNLPIIVGPEAITGILPSDKPKIRKYHPEIILAKWKLQLMDVASLSQTQFSAKTPHLATKNIEAPPGAGQTNLPVYFVHMNTLISSRRSTRINFQEVRKNSHARPGQRCAWSPNSPSKHAPSPQFPRNGTRGRRFADEGRA